MFIAALAAILLIPVAFLIHYLRRPPLPMPVPTITALLYLRWSIAPVVIYAALFLLLAVAEEISGAELISRSFQHSLLVIISVGIPWTLLLTLLTLAIASRRYRQVRQALCENRNSQEAGSLTVAPSSDAALPHDH